MPPAAVEPESATRAAGDAAQHARQQPVETRVAAHTAVFRQMGSALQQHHIREQHARHGGQGDLALKLSGTPNMAANAAVSPSNAPSSTKLWPHIVTTAIQYRHRVFPRCLVRATAPALAPVVASHKPERCQRPGTTNTAKRIHASTARVASVARCSIQYRGASKPQRRVRRWRAVVAAAGSCRRGR